MEGEGRERGEGGREREGKRRKREEGSEVVLKEK